MTPDLAARRLVMSAYLYYRHDSPVLPDPDYDALTALVVARWSELSPLRQWQLESAEAVATTGYHVKVTLAAEAGALAWHRAVLGRYPEGPLTSDWYTHPEFGRWANA